MGKYKFKIPERQLGMSGRTAAKFIEEMKKNMFSITITKENFPSPEEKLKIAKELGYDTKPE